MNRPQIRTLQIGMTASARHTSGTDRYFLALLGALPQHGVTVRGVVLGDPASAQEPVSGLESFAPEGARRLDRWLGVRRSVARLVRGSDVVVAHGAPHAFPALDRIGARPLVVHFHGPWALEGHAEGIGKPLVLVRRIQERAVYARASRFITLSHAFGEILAREYRVPPEAIRVVPGGVDLRRFRPACTRDEARTRLRWPLDRPVVVTVRRLVPSKGLENLIDAVDIARKQVPEIFVAIVGSGPLADALARRIAERGLERWVRLAGFIEDLTLVYRAADLSIVPTLTLEGFGLVVVESLACGTPPLVTPIGGMPEVVNDLEPRLVLEHHGAPALAVGLVDALSGRIPLPGEERCIAYAHRFDWPTIAARVGDIYREVA
jgi:glycosyltransferase involved in cell wall biosynthesis